jgi:uncharacterized protein YndB with AHSA1/START domain
MESSEPSALRHSIEIETTPEKIWEFFINLDKNYTTWHPEDHILFKWTKGEPLREGTSFYAEQYVKGKKTKYKGTCAEIVPNRKIVFEFAFPISIVSPKVEWQIEPKGPNTVFTAITYMRIGRLFLKLFKKHMQKAKEQHDKHVGAEGENLKKILEANKDI